MPNVALLTRGLLTVLLLGLSVASMNAFSPGAYREKPVNARGHFRDAVGMVDRGASLLDVADYLRYGDGPMRSALTVERDREAIRSFYLARARGGDWSDEWFDLDFVRNSFLNASRELRAGAPLQPVLISVGLTPKNEVFQVLNNENFREAVASFLSLWADQRQIEANALYEELLEPSYHFRWFAHTISQGTPLREATNHFKYLSPLMHQALTKEADREAVYHYARVRAGEQTDPGAFFRLKVVQDAFEHALHAIDQGEPLLLALEYLMEGEGTWRSTVLSNERERERVKKYVLACLRADVQQEARYWHELIYFWADRQVANDGDLEMIAAQVRIAAPATPFFRALTQSSDRRSIRAFYRAFALRKYRSNREFFELEAVRRACKGAAALIGAGEPVDMAVSRTGIDSQFSLYPILASEENREDTKSFLLAVSKEQGFDKALEHLSYALEWLRSVDLESQEELELESDPRTSGFSSVQVFEEESAEEIEEPVHVVAEKLDFAPQIKASIKAKKQLKQETTDSEPGSESLRELLTNARKTLEKVRGTRTKKQRPVEKVSTPAKVDLGDSPFTARPKSPKSKPPAPTRKKKKTHRTALQKQNEKAFEDFTKKLQEPHEKTSKGQKIKPKPPVDRAEPQVQKLKEKKAWSRGSSMAAHLFGPSITTPVEPKPKKQASHGLHQTLHRQGGNPQRSSNHKKIPQGKEGKRKKTYELFKNPKQNNGKVAKIHKLYEKQKVYKKQKVHDTRKKASQEFHKRTQNQDRPSEKSSGPHNRPQRQGKKREKTYELYKNSQDEKKKTKKTYELYRSPRSQKSNVVPAKKLGPFPVETVSKTSFTQQPSRSKQSLGRVLQNRFKGLMHKLRKKRRVKPQEKASVAPQKNSSSPFVLDSLPPPPPNRVWREGFLGSKNPVRSLLRSTLIQVDRARELVK